jgi:hypothetical protein
VVIGLGPHDVAAEDAKRVTDVLTDASGGFVAFFTLSGDDLWVHTEEIRVVAHTADLSQVALAALHYMPLPTVTAVPGFTPSATREAALADYVLGYVAETSPSARIITIKPVEGQAEVIALVETSRVIHQGQVVQLQDVRVGDLVEAEGQMRAENSIVAGEVRILTRAQGEATASPAATPTTGLPTWQGEYYDNTTLSGNPSVVRDDPVIDFQWQEGPAAEGLPADGFAVRWTGSWPFEEGGYRFNAQVDDGVRLWLDGHLIVDHWHASTGALYSADAYLCAESHVVRVEYFDARDSAHAKLWWEYRGPDAVLAYPDWKGEYYSNMNLEGSPFLALNERLLDFNWGKGAPADGIPGDDFSARWTRTVDLPEGVHRFHAQVDDGVRLWVDEVLVIDEWQEGAARTFSVDLDLSGGLHSIRVEYYEHTGHARIEVWWEPLPDTPTPTSTALPSPTETPTLEAPTETPVSTEVLPTPSPTMPTHESAEASPTPASD